MQYILGFESVKPSSLQYVKCNLPNKNITFDISLSKNINFAPPPKKKFIRLASGF